MGIKKEVIGMDVSSEELALSELESQINEDQLSLYSLKEEHLERSSKLKQFKDASSIDKQKISFETQVRANFKEMRFTDGRQAYTDEEIEIRIADLIARSSFNPE